MELGLAWLSEWELAGKGAQGLHLEEEAHAFDEGAAVPQHAVA
jgi:hypothetical protein